MKKILGLLIILLIQTGPASAADIDPITPSDVVSQFVYDDIKSAPSTYSDAKSFRKYFTADLKRIFDETIKREKISIKITPKDEKPCIPDAEIFFSNVEHVSAIKILGEKGNDRFKTISLKLAYIYPDNHSRHDFSVQEWNADIFLKFEKNKWLIDDIADSGWQNNRTFKQILTDNLKNGCYVQTR